MLYYNKHQDSILQLILICSYPTHVLLAVNTNGIEGQIPCNILLLYEHIVVYKELYNRK